MTTAGFATACQTAQTHFAALMDRVAQPEAAEPIQRVRARVEKQALADFHALTQGLPEYLRTPLLAKWKRMRKSKRAQPLSSANSYVREFVASIPQTWAALPISLNDEGLGHFARAAADECGQIISQAATGKPVNLTRNGVWVQRPRFVLEAFAKAAECGVLPELATMKVTQLQASFERLQKRLADEKWWRGRLKRLVALAVEQQLVKLGCVDRRRAAYLSNGSFKRLMQRDANNAKALELAEATNEFGQTYTLAELSRRTVANPEIRRTELMVRIRGTEEVMQELGMVGYFVTITAPSKYHACSSKYAQPYQDAARGALDPDATDLGEHAVPRYVRRAYSPRDTQTYLCRQWSQARAIFKKKAHRIDIYGVRVAEPHHDGTPHWHMLIWVAPHQADRMLAVLRAKALEVDGDEKGAQEARFKALVIDPRKGSAAGYLAKYLAKNIDGAFVGDDWESGMSAESGSQRVAKWASCHRIRQFQMFGQPPVTVWRELRKADLLSDENRTERVLHDLHAAADRADWAAFIKFYDGVIGGYRIGFECLTEADKTTGELRQPANKYGEATFVRHAVALFDPSGEVIERIQTRLHEWDVNWKRDNSNKLLEQPAAVSVAVGVDLQRSGGAASTWTCVNNCNPSESDQRAQQQLLAQLTADMALIQAETSARIEAPDFKAALNRLAARDRTHVHRGRPHAQVLTDLHASVQRIRQRSPNGVPRLLAQIAHLESLGADAYDIRP